MTYTDALPPPPYSTSPHSASQAKPSLSALPLHLLQRILLLTLDPRATPSQWSSDDEEERVRRIWALFRGFRGVSRRFYLVATSILRAHFLPIYISLVRHPYSSDPFPPSSLLPSTPADERDLASGSVFDGRARETAVFDRFIAIRVGSDLRRVESSLSEEGEGESDIFNRLQPAARLEDLLHTLPSHLVAPTSLPSSSTRQFPLPQDRLSVTLTPTWAQLYVHQQPISTRGGGGKEMVVQVRRERSWSLEEHARRLRDALQGIDGRVIQWGGRIG